MLSCAAAFSTTFAFPDEEGMERIVRVHHPHLGKTSPGAGHETFLQPAQCSQYPEEPSTSELIDWLQALVVEY